MAAEAGDAGDRDPRNRYPTAKPISRQTTASTYTCWARHSDEEDCVTSLVMRSTPTVSAVSSRRSSLQPTSSSPSDAPYPNWGARGEQQVPSQDNVIQLTWVVFVRSKT